MATQSTAGANANPEFQANLRRLIEAKHIDIDKLAAYIGISPRSVNSYVWGTRTPKWQQTQKIAEYLGVSTAELLGISSDTRLSSKAYQIATVYDKLDDFGRSLMDAVAAHEMERVKIGQEIDEAKNSIEYFRRKLRLYLVPVAAGPGNALSDEDGNYEDIPLPDDAPQDADYAVKVSGDSMEPYIDDGSVIYVKKDTEVREMKDVGVWVYDGEVRIKQWYRDYDGTVFLLSANPKRVSANVKIPPERTDELQCLGKVILERELPNPNYD